MFIPIGDENDLDRRPAYVTYALIAANFVVFLFFEQFGRNTVFLLQYGLIPREILSGQEISTAVFGGGRRVTIPPAPFSVYSTLVTSLFLHAGWAHILGNMLFLWIFGDNIENAFGHVWFLLFYLAGGVVSSLVHVGVLAAAGSGMTSVTIGASGAISAVLGAYLALFPRRRVYVLFIIFPIAVPALIAIGAWIAFQLVRGFATVGGATGGVAYSAHISGFAAGWLVGRATRSRVGDRR